MYLIEDVIRSRTWEQLCDDMGVDPCATQPDELAHLLTADTDEEIIDPDGLFHVLEAEYEEWRSERPLHEQYAFDNGMHDGFDAR